MCYKLTIKLFQFNSNTMQMGDNDFDEDAMGLRANEREGFVQSATTTQQSLPNVGLPQHSTIELFFDPSL